MTLQSSGIIGMDQINAEFQLGNNLGVYRGAEWFLNSGSRGAFFSAPSIIGMADFYSKRKGSPVYVTYPSTATNGTPFTWSISNGVPGEGWWATSNAPNHLTFGSSSSPFGYLDGSGAFSSTVGSWAPDTGTITCTFYFQYGGTQSRTITVSPPPIFYVNVSGPDVNLYWYCIARGWNGSSAVVATTVGDIYGSSTGSWAMIIDAMPSSVTLVNNNYIAGHGGAGGDGAGENVISRTPAPPNDNYTGENGENGGHALYVSASNHGVTVYNYGVIGGGGGGAWFGTGGSGGIAAYNRGNSIDGDPGGTAGYSGTFGGEGGGGSGGNGGYLGQSGNNGYTSASTIGYRYGSGYGAGCGWAVYGTNRVTWAVYGTVFGPVGNT